MSASAAVAARHRSIPHPHSIVNAGAVLWLFLAPAQASAQDLLDADPGIEGLPIRTIEVRPLNLFEPLPAGRLRALYRLANRLHITTRPAVVREQLLFRAGEPWSEARAHETERVLRALDIFEPVRLEARRVGDSVDVRVTTRDAWSTTPFFAIEAGNDQNFISVSVVERNLFGYGKSASFGYDETPERIFRSLGYRDPAVFGSRWRFGLSAGTGSEGAAQGFDLGQPFYAEDTPQAVLLRTHRQTSIARLYEDGSQAAEFDRDVEEIEAWYARGARHGSAILRVTPLVLIRNRRFGPSRLEPGAPPAYDGGEENQRTRLLAVEGRWWRPHFRAWTGVDRLSGIEDIELGRSVRITAGFSPAALGATQSEGYGALRLEMGGSPWTSGFGQALAEGRSWFGPELRESWWRVRGRWVQRTAERHVLVSSALAVLGRRMPRDYQEIAGGLTGLRAYPVREITGAGIARFNIEERWLVSTRALELVSLGLAGFYDAAREIGPESSPSSWRHGLGLGLRLSMPHSSHERVARVDVAWPLRPGTDGRREAVLSIGSSQAF